MVYRERRSDGTVLLTGSGLQAYPIGAIYFSAVAVDPASIFGGTWERFGQGRMLVGVDEADTDFDTPLEIGGAKTHALTISELASHDHNMNHDHGVVTKTVRSLSTTTTGGTAIRVTDVGGVTGGSGGANDMNINIPSYSGTTGTRGSGTPHNNMSPYITVYMYRRTA